MAVQKKSPIKKSRAVPDSKVPSQYKDRNLAEVNPNAEQFEPTDAVPVRQHNKMAGGA